MSAAEATTLPTDAHALAVQSYRLGFAAGNEAAYQWPRFVTPADARLRALDVAQAAGDRAHALERARQGLVSYDRHARYFLEDAS
jgi:hypothetical protein